LWKKGIYDNIYTSDNMLYSVTFKPFLIQITQKGDEKKVCSSVEYDLGKSVRDTEGNFYFPSINHCIYKLDKNGIISIFCGKFGEPGYKDGGPLEARFTLPGPLIYDRRGFILVCDCSDYATIRVVDMKGRVTTLCKIQDLEKETSDEILSLQKKLVKTTSLGDRRKLEQAIEYEIQNLITFHYQPSPIISITSNKKGSLFVTTLCSYIVRKIDFDWPNWGPKTHLFFEEDERKAIRAIMILSLRNPVTGRAKYPQSLIFLLPRDLLFCTIFSIICQ
jgi:hypothetical protein